MQLLYSFSNLLYGWSESPIRPAQRKRGRQRKWRRNENTEAHAASVNMMCCVLLLTFPLHFPQVSEVEILKCGPHTVHEIYGKSTRDILTLLKNLMFSAWLKWLNLYNSIFSSICPVYHYFFLHFPQ